MGLFKNQQLLIIRLVCWLGWLSSFAFAQSDISEVVSGILNFPTLGVTCLGNLAVFLTSLIRGRLDVEMGARDALDILTSPKLKIIKGINDIEIGLTTCRTHPQIPTTQEAHPLTDPSSSSEGLPQTASSSSSVEATGEIDLETASVVILSNGRPNSEGLPQTASSSSEGLPQTASSSSEVEATGEIDLKTASVVILSNGTPNLVIEDFMKSNGWIVDSILLEFRPFVDAENDAENDAKYTLEISPETLGTYPCRQSHMCKCIVFQTVKQITIMLASRMPGTLKQLTDSLYLLPCLNCLTDGCHRCDEGLQHITEVAGSVGLRAGSKVESPAAVVCEILNGMDGQNPIRPGQPICICIPTHDARSDLWTELLLRTLRSKDVVDRGVRVMASEALEGYLVRRRGGEEGTVEYNIVAVLLPRLTEIAINLALTFWFRVDGFSSALLARRATRDYVADSKGSGLAANAFLTKAEVKADANNAQVCQVLSFRGNRTRFLSFIVGIFNLISSVAWVVFIAFERQPDVSPPVSPTIKMVIYFTVAFSFFGTHESFFIYRPISLWSFFRKSNDPRSFWLFVYNTLLVILLVTLIFEYGRLMYGSLQIVVWFQWTFGSYFLAFKKSLEFSGKSPHTLEMLIYSCAFFLNAVLAGVRCKWGPWPWKLRP